MIGNDAQEFLDTIEAMGSGAVLTGIGMKKKSGRERKYVFE